MTNFQCCKSATFPSSYYICVNCYKVFHRSCTLKNKKKYTFLEDFKIKCCDDENNDGNANKSILEETLHELTETSNQKDQYIMNMKRDHDKFMEEVLQREEEFNELISEQKLLLDKANEEIARLRHAISQLTGKESRDGSTQTKKTRSRTILTQTEDKLKFGGSLDTSPHTAKEISHSTPDICCPKNQPKVLIVAGEYGEGLCHLLRNKLDKYYVHAFIKPKASNQELLTTVLNQSRGYNDDDYVILWPKIAGAYLVKDFYLKLQHTNPIILTPHYRFNVFNTNNVIYNNNLALYKEMHAKSIDLHRIIEVNNLLKRTNYNRVGGLLMKTGKRYIATRIAERISMNSIHVGSQSCRGRDHRDIYVLDTQLTSPNPVSESIIHEPQTMNTPNDSSKPVKSSPVKEISLQGDFLYPRLSQVSPQD